MKTATSLFVNSTITLSLLLASSSSHALLGHNSRSRALAENGQSVVPAISSTGIFSSKQNFEFSLRASLRDLFAHRVTPNSPKGGENSDYSVRGELSYTDSNNQAVRIPVEVELRGNTSQAETECVFPKLKLKFKAGAAQGTLFETQKEIGIGTHCNLEAGNSARFFRAWGGKSPHRETALYDMLQELGIPSYQTRRAFGTYIDSSGEVLADRAQAFFLEDMSGIEARLGGREIRAADVALEKRAKGAKAPPYIFQSALQSPGITQFEVARILLFEIMMQNSDYHLRVFENDGETRNLWNMKVLQLDPQKWMLFPYDFDLAGPVRGAGTYKGVEFLKAKITLPTREAVATEFENHKQNLYRIARSLGGDPEGVASITAALDTFFADVANWKQ